MTDSVSFNASSCALAENIKERTPALANNAERDKNFNFDTGTPTAS